MNTKLEVSENLKDVLLALDAKHKHPASDVAFQIQSLLETIENGSPGEQPHVLFGELCNLSAAAFPERNQTNAQITANPATPELMRYLLASMRRYTARINGMEKPTAVDRSNAISNALLMRGGREDKLGKWGLEMQMKYCVAFSHGRYQASKDGDAPSIAYDAGIEAAYLVYRADEADVQDDSDRRKVIKKLREFLKKEGYGEMSPRGRK